VVEEIRMAMQANPMVREFEIVDATFNYPLDYAMEVCEEMVRANLNVPWYCQLTPNAVTPEFVDLLERSGCIRVDLGTDSFSDASLEQLMKGFDMAKVAEVDRLLQKSKVEFTHCVFLGGPGEGSKELRESVMAPLKYLKPNQIYANLGIRILSETKLQRIAVNNGLIEEDHNMFIPTFYVEPELLDDPATLAFVRDIYLQNKNWYLWWGLKGQDLYERSKETIKRVADMHREYKHAMQGVETLKLPPVTPPGTREVRFMPMTQKAPIA
jgi:radical SAM superfamily enzyme YgiQ (UPF0313 family)